ncbi:hypothetical protein BwSH20_27530 [Bradyrhizobium ottawaense]|nr:hypothetical protein SG09_59760 [Bradyrhizobium ottawaense]GMO47362.1 hypothetical protein BwSF21_64690 [Bradyrhizobium ottawaense]GMO50547.1 hypothetical protein BwSH14_71400 [Bradyrhizobium ottawaense]GMO55717.1 hypothetical protein BwSF12_70480 [Bradyrhizobium ottawaense]GMO80618.1 hypothetical protein BwSG10_52950 [Bradyrhizobium ottawaense]
MVSQFMLVRALLLLALLSLPGALRAEGTPAEKPGFASRLTIYLAKGAPDACGPGCDRWIAIEGQIDQDAASRIRRFLAGVKDLQRPIYLHSPGGNVEQSYVIARLLRSRKAIARVGRTIATACAAGTQIDAACQKIKNGNGEVEAELSTYHAMCNSACGYLFLGATSREVAPDAALAVHNSRLILRFQGNPPPEVVAEARRRRIAGADRDRAAFIAAMGISRELDALISTVKFENLHVLTRPELYRFGIDTRPLAETMWRLEKGARPFISKIAAVKKENDASFRTMEWRLYCENKKRVPLMFAGEIDASAAGKKTILIAASADMSKQAGGPPVRFGKYEVWNGAVDPDMVKAVLASHSLQVRETTPEPEGRADVTSFNIDTTGLASVWTQLGTSCTSVATGPAKPWPANSLQPTPWTDSPWTAGGALPNVSATPAAAPAP